SESGLKRAGGEPMSASASGLPTLVRGLAFALSFLIVVQLAAAPARADVITDWNAMAEAIGLQKRLQPPPNARVMAMMHVAMFEAAKAATRRYAAYRLKLDANPGASPEAAAATAAHDVLAGLYPDQQAGLDSVLKASLGSIADGEAKAHGIALGRLAAAGIL